MMLKKEPQGLFLSFKYAVNYLVKLAEYMSLVLKLSIKYLVA